MTLKKWIGALAAAGTLSFGAAAFAHERDGRFDNYSQTYQPAVAQAPCTNDHVTMSPIAHAQLHGVTRWSNTPNYRYSDWYDWQREMQRRRWERTRQMRYGRWAPPVYYRPAPIFPRAGVTFHFGR